MADVQTISCLGRPFDLGMLYDCRNESIIAGEKLWDVNCAITEESQSNEILVFVDDVNPILTQKFRILGNVRLSFLCGLVEVGGFAKYLTSYQTTTTRNRARVTLTYCSKTFQQWLPMDQMHQETIRYPDVFDQRSATHVVSGIQYGAGAAFVFERDIEENEDREQVQDALKLIVDKIPLLCSDSNLNIEFSEQDKKETDNVKCTYFGDVGLVKDTLTFEEAVQVFKELPNLIKETVCVNKEVFGVPVEVSLYPLYELNNSAARIVRQIDENDASQVELFLEQSGVLELMANYLLIHDICKVFPGIYHQIDSFRSNLVKHVSIFKHTMMEILPKIRGGDEDSSTLSRIISKIDDSPFNTTKMRCWIDAKTKELAFLSGHCDILGEFPFANDNVKVDKMTRDNNIKYAVELNFGVVANRNHPFTKKLNIFLKMLESTQNYLEIESDDDDDGDEDFHWLNDKGNVANLKKSSSLFISFFNANNQTREDLKFFLNTGFEMKDSRQSPGNMFLHSDKKKPFEPPSSPGIPILINSAENEIDLKWSKPEIGYDFVTGYVVKYKFANVKDEIHIKYISGINEDQPQTITKLKEDSAYQFQVAASCEAGISEFSDWSQPFKTIAPPPLADFILEHCKEILAACNGQPAWYQLPLRRTYLNKAAQLQKFDVFERYPKGNSNTKVILLLGATGSGKTTLINGLVNYLLGVRMKDSYRFQLITENTNKSQAESQTAFITAYTIYWQPGSKIPFTLTIIDTPGYGDTRGIDQDNQITDQVREFFEMKGGKAIDQLDAIGFVAPASDARLTDTQKYVFDSILSIFGKDIAENIFLMLTFADGRPPPILDAIKTHKLPHQNYFKFNNSVFTQLKQSEMDEGKTHTAMDANLSVNKFDSLFWSLAEDSFHEFFKQLHTVTPKSLKLTREVLHERNLLSVTIDGLQHRITNGVNHLETMRQHLLVIEQFQAEKKANKNFQRTVTVPKMRKITFNEPGRFVTNCLNCNITCHEHCGIPEDKEKHGCWAMDGKGQDASCRICKVNCHWSKHYNKNFYFEEYMDEEVITLAKLKEKYDMADKNLTVKENLIAGLASKYTEVQLAVLEDIETVRACLTRLDEIAMKPNPLTTVDYIEILIRNAEQERKRGWKERVMQLHAAKERAVMIKEMLRRDIQFDPFQAMKQQILDQCRNSNTDVFEHIKAILGINDNDVLDQQVQQQAVFVSSGTRGASGFVGSAISAIGSFFKK